MTRWDEFMMGFTSNGFGCNEPANLQGCLGPQNSQAFEGSGYLGYMKTIRNQPLMDR